MKFNEILKDLMAKNKMSNYRLSKTLGCSATTVKYWLDGTTEPTNRILGDIAAVFGVTTGYLRGEEDELGLSKEDWSMMGSVFKAERLSKGVTLEYLADTSGMVSVEKLANFEENGCPLLPRDLKAISGLVGNDAGNLFSPWKAKLFSEDSKPTVSSSSDGYIRVARGGKNLPPDEWNKIADMLDIIYPGQFRG